MYELYVILAALFTRVLHRRGAHGSHGQGMVEYALILALVAVVVIAALLLLGPNIARVFTRVNSSV